MWRFTSDFNSTKSLSDITWPNFLPFWSKTCLPLWIIPNFNPTFFCFFWATSFWHCADNLPLFCVCLPDWQVCSFVMQHWQFGSGFPIPQSVAVFYCWINRWFSTVLGVLFVQTVFFFFSPLATWRHATARERARRRCCSLRRARAASLKVSRPAEWACWEAEKAKGENGVLDSAEEAGIIHTNTPNQRWQRHSKTEKVAEEAKLCAGKLFQTPIWNMDTLFLGLLLLFSALAGISGQIAPGRTGEKRASVLVCSCRGTRGEFKGVVARYVFFGAAEKLATTIALVVSSPKCSQMRSHATTCQLESHFFPQKLSMVAVVNVRFAAKCKPAVRRRRRRRWVEVWIRGSWPSCTNRSRRFMFTLERKKKKKKFSGQSRGLLKLSLDEVYYKTKKKKKNGQSSGRLLWPVTCGSRCFYCWQFRESAVW